jgi:acyl-CoA thioesterase
MLLALGNLHSNLHMTEPTTVLGALDLEVLAPGRFRGRNVGAGEGVVFGGQLLAQSIVAAQRSVADKQLKSIHTVFARGGSREKPVELQVELLHEGRSFASATVTISQGDRLCTRSLALLEADAPDLIRQELPMPGVGPAEDAAPGAHGTDDWEIRFVDGVDISDPAAVGPAELGVWTRFPGAPADLTTSQALLAYASDGFLIGTAMRPHEGVGQALAHVSISTSVLSHTLTYHEPFAASDWMLLAQQSPYAGRGRSYGRADVFASSGSLIASYAQENMIRAFPQGRAPAAGARAKY